MKICFSIFLTQLLAVLLLIYCTGCTPGTSFYFENDFLTPINKDQQYTQGMMLKNTDEEGKAYFIGQQLYTPGGKQETALQENDRPYAAWLFVGHEQSFSETPTARYTLGVKAGIVGPAALGEETQNKFHEIINNKTAKGWDNQLNNEPGLILYGKAHETLSSGELNNFQFDSVLSYSGNLGNVRTDGSISAFARIGENLPSDFGPGVISTKKPLQLSKWPDLLRPKGYHGFLGVEWNVVARDIFLDGNTFTDSHSVEKNYSIGNIKTGLSVLIDKIRITYTLVISSAAFKEQDGGYNYGSLNFEYIRD